MTDSDRQLTGRARLAAVINAGGNVARIGDVTRTLDLSRAQAAKLLSRWAEQGWLRPVRTGLYVPVELQLLGAEHVVQDAWTLVPALFGPA